MREWEDGDQTLVSAVVEALAFARAWELVQHASEDRPAPEGYWTDQVKAAMQAVALEDMADEG